MFKTFRILCLCLFWGACLSAPLSAQIDSDTLFRNIEKDPSPSEEAPPAPSVEVNPQNSQALSLPKFHLKGVQITQSPFLSGNVLANLSKPYVGKMITIPQLKEFIERINSYLISQGLITVRAHLPPQEVANGVVEIVVTDRVIGNITIRGADRYNAQRFIDIFEDLRGKSIRKEDLDTKINILRKYPSIRPKVSLEPAQEIGKIDIILELNEQPANHFSYSLDNASSRVAGKNRLRLAYALQNPFGFADVLTLGGMTTSSNHLTYVDGSYAKIFGNSGTMFRWTGSGLKSDFTGEAIKDLTKAEKWSFIGYHNAVVIDGETVRPPIVLEEFESIKGSSARQAIELIHPWFTSKGEEVIGRFAIQAVDSENEVKSRFRIQYIGRPTDPEADQFYEFGKSRVKTEDRIRWVSAGWTYILKPKSAQMSWGLELEQGFEGLGAMDRKHVEDGKSLRSKAYPDFRILKFYHSYRRFFPRQFGLKFNLNVQLAGDRVVSGRRFSAGGWESVRGFAPGELLGDSGLLANLELAKLITSTFEFKVFTDYAQAENNLLVENSEQLKRETDRLTSGGFGITWKFWNMALQMLYGKALNKLPDSTNIDNPDRDNGVFYMKLGGNL